MSAFGKYLCQHCASPRTTTLCRRVVGSSMLKPRFPQVTPCVDTNCTFSKEAGLLCGFARTTPRRLNSATPKPYTPHMRYPHALQHKCLDEPQLTLIPHSSLLIPHSSLLTPHSSSLSSQENHSKLKVAQATVTRRDATLCRIRNNRCEDGPSIIGKIRDFHAVANRVYRNHVALPAKIPSPELHHDPN